MGEADPAILMVAPNGARKTKADHPAVPIGPSEIAEEAVRCREAGASMLHLHVRQADGRHLLDAEAYKAATEAIRQAVGSDMVVQITTEAVGIYSPDEQMAVVREARPEAVSLAVREILPDEESLEQGAAFLAWLGKEHISPQYILYDAADVERFDALRKRGVIPGERAFVLYVLGRYSADQQSNPLDLLPFLGAATGGDIWAVCAFGARESACAAAALALGGHARVGFENNLLMADGGLARHNADLVSQARGAVGLAGRALAGADQVREILAAL